MGRSSSKAPNGTGRGWKDIEKGTKLEKVQKNDTLFAPKSHINDTGRVPCPGIWQMGLTNPGRYDNLYNEKINKG